MKRFQIIAAYLLAFALTGVVSLKSEQPGGVRQGEATIRSITGPSGGTATYSINGAPAQPLKNNMHLPPGASITTGPDTTVYMSVNGISSAVRIQPETTLSIPQMDKIGEGRQGDTQTQLDLAAGNILGQVKKVSANSTYEIKTPHGVAGIRGTDFQVSVENLGGGQFKVTFTSVTGLVIVSAVVDGQVQTKTLHDGESWTPGQGDIHRAPVSLIQAYAGLINQLEKIVIPLPVGATVTVPVRNPYGSQGAPPTANSSQGTP